MNELPTYRSYTGDERHMRAYAEYQARYADTIRESDRVLIDLVRAAADASTAERPRLIDIGCSTGNLLLHIKHALPALELHGGDIVADIIAECRRNEALEGIAFEVLDILDPPRGEAYDIVTVNASLMFFEPAEFTRAVAGLASLLVAGGTLVAFDYFHPFRQELEVLETSAAFPDRLRLFMRSYDTVLAAASAAGLEEVEFRPFDIPIDLPRPDDVASIGTWTERTAEGRGLSFRGSLFQPWCHMVARKG
jgi:SAM-dependent methyltransferase